MIPLIFEIRINNILIWQPERAEARYWYRSKARYLTFLTVLTSSGFQDNDDSN